MLILAVGLPGTGKSTLCRAAADYCKGAVLNNDAVRAALFEPGYVRYSVDQDDLVQEFVLRAAEWLQQENPELKIFIDGRTFSRSYQIWKVIQTAERIGTSWRVFECICRESTALQRIDRDRQNNSHPARNRDAALYERIKSQFEPVTVPKVVVDTDQPLSECILRVICSL